MSQSVTKTLLFIYSLLTILYGQVNGAKQFSVSLVNSEINASADIYLQVTPTSRQYCKETHFEVHFPAHIGFSLQGTLTCREQVFSSGGASDSNFEPALQPTCIAQTDPGTGALVVTVSGLTQSKDPGVYTVIINGLKNGPSASSSQSDPQDQTTGAFVKTFASGTLCETIYAQSSFSFMAIQKNSGVTFSMDPAKCGAQGTLTVNFLVSYAIPIDGSIQIKLPRQNYQYANLGVVPADSMIVSTSSLTVTGYYKKTQTRTLPGNLNVQVQTEPQLDLTYKDLIKIKLGNSAEIPAEAVLTVKLQKIKAPPNMKPFGEGQLQVQSGDTNFNYIENAFYNQMKIQNTDPGDDSLAPVRSAVEITTSAGVSEADSEYQFRINIVNPIPKNGYWTLYVPQGVGMPSGGASGLKLTCESVNAHCDTINLSYSSSTRIISFNSALTHEQDYIQPPGPIVFSLRGFVNPATADSQFFKFTSYAFLVDGFYKIDELSNLSINAQQGACAIDAFYPTDLNYMMYGVASNWTLNITCEHEITANDGIRITFPEDFYVLDTSICKVGDVYTPSHSLNKRLRYTKIYSELNPQYTCQGDNAKRTITIFNYLKETMKPNTLHRLTFNSVRNPNKYKQSANYKVKFETLSRTDGAIDIGEFTIPHIYMYRGRWEVNATARIRGEVFQKGNITQFDVIPSDYGVGAYPVFYTFRIRPSGEIWRYSYLRIVIPDEVRIYDEKELERECNYDLSGFTSRRISCKVRGKIIEIRNGFDLRETTSMTTNLEYFESLREQQNTLGRISEQVNNPYYYQNRLYLKDSMEPPQLVFSLPQFWNPRTMDYSGVFQVHIFDQYNYMIYQYNQTANVTVNGDRMYGMATGPRVKMSIAAKPKSVTIAPQSKVNGQVTEYDITIQTTNFLSEKDEIVIGVPYPISFSADSQVVGLSSNLKQEQPSTVSVSLNQITIDIRLPLYQFGRQLQTTRAIPAGEAFTLRLTKIKNPISTAPTTGSISYASYTDGQLIERLDSGLHITMEQAGQLDEELTSIRPADFRQNVASNYTLTFRPLNYQQNMQIVLTLAPEVEFGGNEVKCYGLQGTDTEVLECKTDVSARNITVTNAVAYQKGNPGIIKIAIEALKNPAQNIVTTSFMLHTYTFDGYHLDAQIQDILINFFCEYPCKTCADEVKDQCLSCYYADEFPILYKEECLDECPFGLYANPLNECLECKHPCASCSEREDNCIECAKGYWMNSNNDCVKQVFWFFPFFLQGAFWFFIIACSECWTKTESRFKEAFVAFVSVPEIQSWFAFMIATVVEFGPKEPFIFSIIAIWLYSCINLIHTCVHSRKIVPNSMHSYKALHKNYKASTYCIRFLSYCISFKLSLLLVSYFFLWGRFKGDYSKTNWRQFNKFSLVWILLPCPIMIIACSIQLYKFGFFSYSGFIAIEVIFISAMMSSILLLDATSALRTFQEKDPDGVKPNGAARLGLGADYESEDEQYGKRALKKRRKNKLQQDEFGADEADPQDDFSYQSYHLKQPRSDILSRANSETNRQIMMLEELAIQMKDEKEQLRLEKERFEREKALTHSVYTDRQTDVQTMRKIEPYNYQRESQDDQSFIMADQSSRKLLVQRPLLRQESNFSDLNQSQSLVKNSSRRDYKNIENDMEDYDRADDGERRREGVKQKADLPQPIYGQVNYDREKGDNESMVQQITPRAGGDSFIGQHDKEDVEQLNLGTGIRSALYSKADNHGSLGTNEENLIRSQASFQITNDQHQKVATAQLFDQRSDAQQEVDSEKRETQENQDYWEKEDAAYQEMEKESDRHQNLFNINNEQAEFSELRDKQEKQDHEKYLVRERATAGEGEKPLSRKDGTPIIQMRQDDNQAFGQNGRDSAEGMQSRQATPIHEFEDLRGYRGSADPIPTREGEFAMIRMPEKEEEIYQPETQKQAVRDELYNKEGEMTEVVLDMKRGSQGRMSDAERSKQGTQQQYMHEENKALFQENKTAQEGTYEEQGFDKERALFSELTDRQKLDEQVIRPVQPLYDKVKAYDKNEKEKAFIDRDMSNAQGKEDTRVMERNQDNLQSTEQNFRPPAFKIYEDESGASESSEGIVDHNPFQTAAQMVYEKGEVKKKNQDQNRSVSPQKEGSPQVQTKKKQVIYSDKSESSIDEMMGDTPSNYNIANGRMDGKSLGLKAILLHAQKNKNNFLTSLLEEKKDLEEDNNQQKTNQSPRNIGIKRSNEDEERKFVNKIKTEQSSVDLGWANISQPYQKVKNQQVIDPSSDEQPFKGRNTKQRVKTNKQFQEAPLSRNVVGKSYQQPISKLAINNSPQKNNFL